MNRMRIIASTFISLQMQHLQRVLRIIAQRVSISSSTGTNENNNTVVTSSTKTSINLSGTDHHSAHRITDKKLYSYYITAKYKQQHYLNIDQKDLKASIEYNKQLSKHTDNTTLEPRKLLSKATSEKRMPYQIICTEVANDFCGYVNAGTDNNICAVASTNNNFKSAVHRNNGDFYNMNTAFKDLEDSTSPNLGAKRHSDYAMNETVAQIAFPVKVTRNDDLRSCLTQVGLTARN